MKKTIQFISTVAIGGVICVDIHKHTKWTQKKARAEGKHIPYGLYEACIKRPLDFMLSLFALVILSPVLLVVAVLVKIKLGSPVIFAQERPGKDEEIFKLYKFRTMTDERDENGELLSDEVRLTKFGRILRSTSLDELPELWNIVSGNMSIVGPRPLLEQYLPVYTQVERHRHDVRPGLTGLAQINGRNFVKWDDRLNYDVQYVSKITFLRDLVIIWKTLGKVFMHEDVAVNTEEIDEGYLDKIRAAKIE